MAKQIIHQSWTHFLSVNHAGARTLSALSLFQDICSRNYDRHKLVVPVTYFMHNSIQQRINYNDITSEVTACLISRDRFLTNLSLFKHPVMNKHVIYRYQLTEPQDGEFGTLYNGQWTGMVGELMKGVSACVYYMCL